MTLEAKNSAPKKAIRSLTINKISSTSLSQFLKTQESSLKIPEPSKIPYFSHYIDVFAALRTLPTRRQEELLVCFFTQKVENFPNGERLARFLTKINNISWFEPKEEPHIQILQQLSNKYFQRINAKPLPLRIIREDWEVAQEAARIALHCWGKKSSPYQEEYLVGSTMLKVAETTLRFPAWRATWLMVHEMANWDFFYADREWHLGARRAATDAAIWMTIEDLMPTFGYNKGNPFEVLFEGVYNQGYWFIGPVKGESVIFVPEIKKAAKT
jgi:hypothetical protein